MLRQARRNIELWRMLSSRRSDIRSLQKTHRRQRLLVAHSSAEPKGRSVEIFEAADALPACDGICGVPLARCALPAEPPGRALVPIVGYIRNGPQARCGKP